MLNMSIAWHLFNENTRFVAPGYGQDSSRHPSQQSHPALRPQPNMLATIPLTAGLPHEAEWTAISSVVPRLYCSLIKQAPESRREAHIDGGLMCATTTMRGTCGVLEKPTSSTRISQVDYHRQDECFAGGFSSTGLSRSPTSSHHRHPVFRRRATSTQRNFSTKISQSNQT